MTRIRVTVAGVLAALVAAASIACSGGSDDPSGGTTPVMPTPTVDVFRATPVNRQIALSEWKIEGMPERVTGGVNNFTAVNEGTVIHELSVLQVFEGDRVQMNGQTQRLEPGQSAIVSVLLDAGTYQLSCLIAPGESGSTENHLLKGMKTRFVVE